jgi:hypothetical protein
MDENQIEGGGVTGAEVGLTGEDQITICLAEMMQLGRAAETTELYAAVERHLSGNTLSEQGRSSLRNFINKTSVARGWVEPHDPAHPGWRITATGRAKIIEADEPTADPGLVAERTRSLLLLGPGGRPPGNATPEQTAVSTTGYVRDIKVRVYVLKRANGICEAHEGPAPFIDDRGRPFLEVHHVVPLAEGGPDTVENAAALCPDCHRAQHYARDRDMRRAELSASVIAKESASNTTER